MIIIIIAFKGAVRDVLQHVRSSSHGVIACKSRATHRALITYNVSCATWYEGAAQLLSLTELKLHFFSFISLTGPLTDEGRKGAGGGGGGGVPILCPLFSRCTFLPQGHGSGMRYGEYNSDGLPNATDAQGNRYKTTPCVTVCGRPLRVYG